MARNKWHSRPNVRNCEWKDFEDCVFCGGGPICTHEDVEYGEECCEIGCPLFDCEKKRWKKVKED